MTDREIIMERADEFRALLTTGRCKGEAWAPAALAKFNACEHAWTRRTDSYVHCYECGAMRNLILPAEADEAEPCPL